MALQPNQELEAAALDLVEQLRLCLGVDPALQLQIDNAEHIANRSVSMQQNRLAGTTRPFSYIPARPNHPPLPRSSFPANYNGLLRLTARRTQACINAYGIVIEPGTDLDGRRRAVGAFIGVVMQ